MTSGGHVRLPDGSVVVALCLPRPAAPSEAAQAPQARPRVRVLVHARNRARALTRVRNQGLRSVYLRGNGCPPTADEISAVLHHPDGLVWRTTPGDDTEPWHPIESLFPSLADPAPGPPADPARTPSTPPAPPGVPGRRLGAGNAGPGR